MVDAGRLYRPPEDKGFLDVAVGIDRSADALIVTTGRSQRHLAEGLEAEQRAERRSDGWREAPPATDGPPPPRSPPTLLTPASLCP
jgi:hypothetical protein